MGGIIQPANEDLLNQLNSEFESMHDFGDSLNALVQGLPSIPCSGLHSKMEEPVLDLQTRPIDNKFQTNNPGLVEVNNDYEFGHVSIGGVHPNSNSEYNICGIHAVDDLGLANYIQDATQICSAGNVCVESLNKEDEIGGPVFVGAHVGSNNVIPSFPHSVPATEGAANLLVRGQGTFILCIHCIS
ncbi:galactonate dehydratase [Sesbania bispinosa]|nr:galactonate dehydratase [Sesbania bispinosa]